MNNKISLAVTAALVFLTACSGGGGGSDSARVSVTTAEGLWVGNTSTSRSMTGIVLDNGAYWVLYSAPNNSAVIAGVVVGKGNSLNGSFSSSNGIDVNLEGKGIKSVTVSASYVAKQSLNGSITSSAPDQALTFTSSYNAAFDQIPSLSSIAGTYAGVAFAVGVQELTTVVITSTGVVSGSATNGCQFSGSVTPRANGSLYNLSLTFAGGACSNGTSTVTGITYLDVSAKNLYNIALNNDFSNGYIFVGNNH